MPRKTRTPIPSLSEILVPLRRGVQEPRLLREDEYRSRIAARREWKSCGEIIDNGLFAQGAAVANLAVELSRLASVQANRTGEGKKPLPSELMGDAWSLIREGCELVSCASSASHWLTPGGKFNNRGITFDMLCGKGAKPFTHALPNGKRTTWMPYNSEEGFKRLLLNHAMRMVAGRFAKSCWRNEIINGACPQAAFLKSGKFTIRHFLTCAMSSPKNAEGKAQLLLRRLQFSHEYEAAKCAIHEGLQIKGKHRAGRIWNVFFKLASEQFADELFKTGKNYGFHVVNVEAFCVTRAMGKDDKGKGRRKKLGSSKTSQESST